MSEQAKSTPAGLSESGTALWESVTRDYALEHRETAVLLAACRAVDAADALAAVVASEGLLTGDGRPHPALAERRLQDQAAQRALASLRFPEGEEEDARRPRRRGGARGAYGPRVGAW